MSEVCSKCGAPIESDLCAACGHLRPSRPTKIIRVVIDELPTRSTAKLTSALSLLSGRGPAYAESVLSSGRTTLAGLLTDEETSRLERALGGLGARVHREDGPRETAWVLRPTWSGELVAKMSVVGAISTGAAFLDVLPITVIGALAALGLGVRAMALWPNVLPITPEGREHLELVPRALLVRGASCRASLEPSVGLALGAALEACIALFRGLRATSATLTQPEIGRIDRNLQELFLCLCSVAESQSKESARVLREIPTDLDAMKMRLAEREPKSGEAVASLAVLAEIQGAIESSLRAARV